MPPRLQAADPNSWRLAQAGDPDAIALLINRCLRAQAIEASATVQAQCLRLTLRSQQVLNPDKVVPWLQAGLAKLNLVLFQRVEVVAWNGDAREPTWSRTLAGQLAVPAGAGVSPAHRPPLAPGPRPDPSASPISVNIQAQDITGQVVVGHHNIVVGPGGNLVVYPRATHPRPKIRPIALGDRLKPPAFASLLDRRDESQVIAQALERGQSIECFSLPGFGKTALLRATAHRPTVAPLFPDGIVYIRARRRPLADVVQALFEAFYAADCPLKPTEIQIRRALKGQKALVMVDDLDLEREDVQALLINFPDLTFWVTTQQQHLWGDEATAVPLQGLPLGDGIALIERTLGRSLDPQERAAAEALCRHLQGHPLGILQAIATVKEKRIAIAAWVQQVLAATRPEQVTVAAMPGFPQPAQRLLAVLATLGGLPLDPLTLAAVTGNPNVAASLETLAARHWVRFDGQRYRLAENLVAPLQQVWPLGEGLPRITGRLAQWMERHRQQPEVIGQNADTLVQVMELAAQEGQWLTVQRLGQLLDVPLVMSGQWGQWEQVLQLSLQAAQATGDRAAEALALHQLGSRALGLGDPLTANRYLTEALDQRQAIGDAVGADLTRHNLNQLYGSLTLDPDPPLEVEVVPPPPPVTAPPTQGRRLPRLALVAPLLLGVVTTAVLWPRPVPLRLSPEALEFAATALNDRTSQTVTLTNTGRNPLSLSHRDFSLEGDSSADYGILANTCVELSPLPPGDDCTFSLEFVPQQIGDRTAQLGVEYAPGRQVTVALTGQGIAADQSAPPISAAPDLRFDRRQLSFAEQGQGTVSDPLTVDLINQGEGEVSLPLDAFRFDGDHPEDFELMEVCPSLASDRPGEIVLGPGARCSVQVIFKPQAGGDRTAVLSLQAAGLATPPQLQLLGTSTLTPELALSPSALTFDHPAPERQGEFQTVTVTSRGTAPVTITAVALVGDQAREFTLGDSTCAEQELPPQATCTLQIAFNPRPSRDASPRQAQLQIQSTAVNAPHTIPLVGEARANDPDSSPHPPAQIQLSSERLNFGPQPVNVGRETTVTVVNSGAAPLQIDGITITGRQGDDFALRSDCSTVPPQGRCPLTVQFRPTGPGDREATLTITSNAANRPSLSLPLQGQGVIPSLSVNPSTVDFGYGNPPVKTIDITSTGAAPLTLETISLEGGEHGFFGITANGCTGRTLPTNQTCTVDVIYHGKNLDPESSSSSGDSTVSTTLVIRSNAASGVVRIPLIGHRLI